MFSLGMTMEPKEGAEAMKDNGDIDPKNPSRGAKMLRILRRRRTGG